jgi:AraC-like DNA-binding protein
MLASDLPRSALRVATRSLEPVPHRDHAIRMPMDPLSDVLSLLEARSHAARGFRITAPLSLQFAKHAGIKCYAIASGSYWLAVEGISEPFALNAGDCLLLPRGRPFRLATDLSLPPVPAEEARRANAEARARGIGEDGSPTIVGGHFHFAGHHAELLLEALPPVVHIRDEAQKATMRWSLDRLCDELAEPRPGSSLIAQQLAYTMLIQAFRLHMADPAFRDVGWLFALADKSMNAAISLMHADPAHPWTVKELAQRVGMSRSVFALRFKETVGTTPMEYLTRWRVLRAGQRLRTSDDSIAEIAGSLGYESDSAFRKAFRGVMGCSPREYGRSAREDGSLRS